MSLISTSQQPNIRIYQNLFLQQYYFYIINTKIISKDMCGRLYQTLPLARLLKIAKAQSSSNADQHNSSYNVCPTTYIPAIKPSRLYLDEHKSEGTDDVQLDKQQNRQVQFMTWGHKTHFNFIVNGRIQELLNKKTFLNFIENRCVVIMEGYYEWNQKKQPFSFKPIGADHFLVAALYTPEKQIIILTKDATPQLSSVHHRMPVILSHQEVNLWMNPKNTKIINDVIQKSLLQKNKQVWKNIGCAKLGPHVSSIKQKSSKCLMTYEEYKKQLDKTGLMRFWKKAPAVQAVNKDGEVVKVSDKHVEKAGQIKQNIQIEQNNQRRKLQNIQKESIKQNKTSKQDHVKQQSQKIKQQIKKVL